MVIKNTVMASAAQPSQININLLRHSQITLFLAQRKNLCDTTMPTADTLHHNVLSCKLCIA